MKSTLVLLALGAFAAPSFATLYTMDFDTDALGNPIATESTCDEQYAAWGFHFAPNAYSGAGWATNSDMTITSTSFGGGYDPSMGNILHSFDGWLSEDDDPSMLVSCDQLVSSISVDFIGDFDNFSFVALYDSSLNLVGQGFASGSGAVKTVTATAPLGNAKYIALAPGWFLDWVGVDNLKVEAVPEPASVAVIGLGALALLRRKRA